MKRGFVLMATFADAAEPLVKDCLFHPDGFGDIIEDMPKPCFLKFENSAIYLSNQE
jgi:hypothetical protein